MPVPAYLFGRRSLVGVLRLPVGWMAEMDATTRLLYVRVAMFVLAEQPDPSSVDVGPMGADWLRDLYAHSRPRGWEGRFKHAIRDPLLLFTTQLLCADAGRMPPRRARSAATSSSA